MHLQDAWPAEGVHLGTIVLYCRSCSCIMHCSALQLLLTAMLAGGSECFLHLHYGYCISSVVAFALQMIVYCSHAGGRLALVVWL